MPSFDKRHINRKALEIFKRTGKVIACYERLDPPNELANRVPTSLVLGNRDAQEGSASYKKYFIFAKFERSDVENANAPEGRTSAVYGNIKVPYLYRQILAKTEYFDPYLNGSKFIKSGGTVDDENLFIYQAVTSTYLPELGETR